MSFDIRDYRGGDEAAIVRAWNRSLPQDPISPEVFRARVLLDPSFRPEDARVAWQGDELIGFALAVARRLPLAGSELESEQGWITVFFVTPEQRNRGIGCALLESAEKRLAGLGRARVDFSSYAPNYFLPGVDPVAYPEGLALLEKRGYRVLYSPVAMDRSIVGYSYPDQVAMLELEREQEGYRFEPLSDPFVAETIRFAADRFNADWGRALREALLKGIPLNRVLICLAPGGGVVGFCLFGGYDGLSDRFGPFGVDESQRGKGLGKVLLHRCMHAMRQEGIHNLWFLWTGETSPAGQLYLKAGFTVTRKFHVMRRELA
jgi:mycothiol synthase